MTEFLTQLLRIIGFFKTRVRLEAEILVLRQQMIVLSRKSQRARLRNTDRLLFVWFYRLSCLRPTAG